MQSLISEFQLCSIPFLQIVSNLCGDPADMIEFNTPDPTVILETPKITAQVEIFNVSSNEKVLIDNYHQVENMKDELWSLFCNSQKNLTGVFLKM